MTSTHYQHQTNWYQPKAEYFLSIQSKIYARCLLGAFTVAGYIVSKCKISSKIQLVHKILVNKGMRPIRSITYSILDISAIICQKHRILDATMTAQDWIEKGMWSKLWYAPGPSRRDWKLARTSWGAWRVPSISPQGYLFCFLHKNDRLYGTENSWGNHWEPIKSVDDDIMFSESVNLDYFIIFVDSWLKCVLSNGYLNLVWPTQFSYRQNKPVAKRPNTCLSPHNNHFPI